MAKEEDEEAALLEGRCAAASQPARGVAFHSAGRVGRRERAAPAWCRYRRCLKAGRSCPRRGSSGAPPALALRPAFARHTGGKFLLRIEDTDRERSTEAAVQAIFDGLTWLGLDWDGEPTMQFARASRHAEVAQELLARGQAYYCYCSPEELAQMREEARAAGKPPRYDRRWRDRDPSEAPPGVAPVIRIKARRRPARSWSTTMQGKVVSRPRTSTTSSSYAPTDANLSMLAVVVDDHDMVVTHIIRGDDHLTNAARQIVIYNGMG